MSGNLIEVALDFEDASHRPTCLLLRVSLALMEPVSEGVEGL